MNKMKKTLLLSALFSVLILATGCDVSQGNLGDNSGYMKCTDNEKDVQACDMLGDAVCGDNGKTYDNKCLACASNEIDGYVLGACEATCDEEEGVCKIEEKAVEDEEDTSPTQEIGLELMVVDPAE